MALMPIAPPPGFVRQNTEYQAGGNFSATGSSPPRWWDGNLVRWYGAQLGPVGGWRKRSNNALTGSARSMLAWKDNSATRWIGVGTNSKLYVQDVSGTNHDITPSSFTAGDADEMANVGYGAGPFGTGQYGNQRPDTSDPIPALVWDLDLWNDNLIACAFSDGRIVQWALNTGTPAAAVTNAPTGCYGALVTEEGFLFAVAPGGALRTLQWSDQANNTVWTPSSTNQAGSVALMTFGTIKKAARLGPLVLVLTDQDAHIGTYVGLPSIWNFQRIGAGCGVLSRGATVAMGQRAAWWSRAGFWVYDGALTPVDCDVWDFVRTNLNWAQTSKITAFHNADFGEAWWFYPSSASTEIDSYVAWDYRNDHWMIGTLARTCATQPGVFTYPLAIDTSGYVNEHEVGNNYSGVSPFARTGPIQLGQGDQLMNCDRIIPDEKTVGDVTAQFLTRVYTNGPQTIQPPITGNATGLAMQRWQGRQAELLITGAANDDWRWGMCEVNLSPAGGR